MSWSLECARHVLRPRIALNRLNPFAIPLSQGGASLALGLGSGSPSGCSPDPEGVAHPQPGACPPPAHNAPGYAHLALHAPRSMLHALAASQTGYLRMGRTSPRPARDSRMRNSYQAVSSRRNHTLPDHACASSEFGRTIARISAHLDESLEHQFRTTREPVILHPASETLKSRSGPPNRDRFASASGPSHLCPLAAGT